MQNETAEIDKLKIMVVKVMEHQVAYWNSIILLSYTYTSEKGQEKLATMYRKEQARVLYILNLCS